MTESAVALMFPGQGSQAVGMLADWALKFPVIEQTFQQASSVLGYDLWKRTQQGPATLLNQTACAQPALLAASVALWRVWQQQEQPNPKLTAGHSLGEYSALVCAGVLDFEAAVWLVAQRGRLMQEAIAAGEGTMVAVLGLSEEQVGKACIRAAQGAIVSAANFNAPGQIVIAGNRVAIERAVEYCRLLGAKRLVPLAVSVPAHCALMKPAAEAFEVLLDQRTFQPPKWPVIHNVDVKPHQKPSAIKTALVSQLYSPVRWQETLCYFRDQGLRQLIELGPGNVLTGLAKRTIPTLPVVSLQPSELNKVNFQ
ncbi:MAG: ACP S-malonyltransferase [Candidatus Symbiodolus clandestinus]